MRTHPSVAESMQRGLEQIRTEFDVPAAFPAEVLAAAEAAAARPLRGEHVDRTSTAFVTLDPAPSTDLDQAFAIERAGSDLLLHYAIADVGWFVAEGDVIDTEAWRRGETLYLPDGRAPLYPPRLCEDAASLLPDGPRPAVVFTVRLPADGAPALAGVERAVVRSRAKLAYDSVRSSDLPDGFDEFARRMAAQDEARGASRIEPPEQEIEAVPGDGYRVVFRPRLASEDANAALSLATNMAVGGALLAARAGLFRVMAEPDDRAVNRLRHTAVALGVPWPADQSLQQVERTLEGTSARDAAFMLAIRRASGGARYVPWAEGVVPWHAAVAATYSHATAPLRRLADRFVVEAALAVANGRAVSAELSAAFDRLPEVMERADTSASRLDRAVIDLAEAAVLRGQEGSTFMAIVTDDDDRGARVQLRDVAVVARVAARGVAPGDEVRLKLLEADPEKRLVRFERVA